MAALVVRPRVCYSRPATEEPKTTSFVEVDEVETDQSRKRVFTGWMFAESPGLNAVEHPDLRRMANRLPRPQRSAACYRSSA